jgi:hypothetical protein
VKSGERQIKLIGRMHSFSVIRYLLVPLSLVSSLTILFFAVFLTAAEHSGLFGIPLGFGVALLLVGYGFALLEHVMDGRPQPLVLSMDMRSAYLLPAIGTFLLVCACYYTTERLRQWTNPYVVTALQLLLIALLPAIVGMMSMTGRFIDALNPFAVIGTIGRMPAAYLTLVTVLVVLWVIPLSVIHANASSLSTLRSLESFFPLGMLPVIGLRGALLGLLGHIVMVYVWLATFACLGGTLYERRLDLNFQPAESPERKAERSNAELERQRAGVMHRLFGESRGGALATARKSVLKIIADAPRPLDECRWLYQGAAAFEDPRLANYLAQLLLPMLLSQRATGEALEIVRARLAVAADFRPQTAEQLLRLVDLACVAGDRATARQLLAEIDRHYGTDPLAQSLVRREKELQH